MRYDQSAAEGVAHKDITMKNRARKRACRTALPTWFMVAASAGMLGVMACSSDDNATGTGGSVGTGGTVGSGGSVGTGGTVGTGGARPDASSGGGGTATGGGGSATGGAAGTGGVRADAAPEAAPEAASDAPSLCPFDAGDGSFFCCIDSDLDGVPDCVDVCPGDPLKTTTAGPCGCGLPDTDTDTDNTPDCLDGCPQDRNRIAPGRCGCGVPDNTPLCLVHRYSFNDRFSPDAGAGDAGNVGVEAGEGGVLGTTVVADSIGHADGTAIGVALTGTGSVHLAGGQSNQFIQLPPNIISALGDNATFEAWVTWDGTGGVWQRIFDFGASDTGAGNQGLGQQWVFLSPQSGPGFLLASILTPVGGVNEAPGPGILAPNVMSHVAAVLDTASGDASAASLSLYLNGSLQGRVTMTDRLSTLRDINNWLGKSQFVADPEFAGTYHEFRIYSAARTSAQVLADFTAGPDTLPAQ